MKTVLDNAADVPTIVWIVGSIALLLLGLGLWLLYRYIRRRPAEDTLTVIAASIATGVSAQGMWRFTGDVLGFDGFLRMLLFGFVEVAIVTSAVRARRNMRESAKRAKVNTWETPSAGVDGVAVWALTVLTAVLSSMDARSLAEAVFRLAAPMVAAWLWERGMAVERKRITGLAGIHWRLTPERVLVRLGLAEAKDRTADEVDTHRRLTCVALAAVRVRELTEAGGRKRRLARAHRRLRSALEAAEEHTDLATTPATQRILLDKVITLRSGTGLAQLADVLPWADLDHPAVTGAGKNSEAVRLAGALDEWTAAIEREHDPEVSAAVTSMAAYISGRHLPYGGSATSSPVADEVAQQVALTPLGAPWASGESESAATRGATSSATRTATSEQVALEVADEVTDDDIEAIIAALRGDDSDTDDDTETATASATEAMWRHWERVTKEESRLPTGAELARAGGCADSYGRKMRKLWEDQMDGRTRGRLLRTAKRVTA
ncbi:hypothetical protein AB0J28_00790 [Streptosporangium canum]|uniref:hypothetical protein n=1 Tax=Streptosporangium canum TaxID=324952 RepID=UPI00343FE6C0